MPIVQCHITKVEQEIGSEWASIHTDDSTVKKLSTKRPELISEAAGFKNSGTLVGIDYAESVKTKQGSDGTPRTYRDFYYNGGGALAGNGAGTAVPGVDIVQPAARGEDPDRSWRICLQSGAKLAVATLPLLEAGEPRDWGAQKVIARAWAEYFYFTPRPESPRVRLEDLNSIPANAPTASAYHDEPLIEQPPPLDDVPY